MSRYPPLTDDELRELYHRNPSPEARRLLWEVDRLHGLIFDVAQFLNTLDQTRLQGEQLVAFSTLLAATDAEPAVQRKRYQERRPHARVLGCEMVEPFVGPPEAWQVRAAQIGAMRQKPRRR